MATRGKRDAGVNEWRAMSTARRTFTKPFRQAPRFSLYHALVGMVIVVAVVVGVDFFLPLLKGFVQ